VMIFMNSLYLILSTRWPSINFSNIQVTWSNCLRSKTSNKLYSETTGKK
jgi:hypothetical protein